MGFTKKRYVGGLADERTAARLYDLHALASQGVRAKTNFSYTAQELMELLSDIELVVF